MKSERDLGPVSRFLALLLFGGIAGTLICAVLLCLPNSAEGVRRIGLGLVAGTILLGSGTIAFTVVCPRSDALGIALVLWGGAAMLVSFIVLCLGDAPHLLQASLSLIASSVLIGAGVVSVAISCALPHSDSRSG